MTQEQRNDVRDLLNLEDGLSKWDIEFLDSLERTRWEDDKPLSPKQAACLQKIVTRKL